MDMKMLDLFSGLGGASRAFRENGWEVVTVELDPAFKPDYCMDIREFNTTEYYDLVWASPPCTEFSKMSMPWFDHSVDPDVSLVKEALRVIQDVNPRWWVIENVRGAVPYFREILGDYQKRVGSRYLWGDFPIFDTNHVYGKWKIPNTKNRASLRSEIPYNISLALMKSIEVFGSC